MASFQQPFYESPMVDAKAAFPSTDEMLDESLLGMISPDMSPKEVRRTYSQDGSVHFEADSESWPEASQQMQVQMPPSLDQAQNHVQNVGIAHPQWATPAPTMFSGSPGYEWPQPESVAYAGGVMDPLDPMVTSMQHRQSFPLPSVEAEPREWSSACQAVPEHSMQSPRFDKHSLAYGRTSSNMRFRGDGIRKKNARFEIPAEVNLDTVDRLISQATDDALIKELKQQKRLLRNRQAALDSRLRKKQHTEKLEGEMKRASMTIQQIQGELERVKRIEEAQRNEHAMMVRRNSELQCHIEELKAQHIRETEELKQKNASLRYQVDKYVRSSAELNFAGVEPSWAGFGTEETLRIVGSDMQNEFSGIDTPSLSPASSPSFSAIETVPACKETGAPFSWDVFCMCLLLGAFVASRSGTLVPDTMYGLSENYSKEAKRLIGSVFPKSVSTTGPLVGSLDDSKLEMFMSMEDHIINFNSMNRDTLQQVFNALKCMLPKGKATVSEQTVRDFKTLLNTSAITPSASASVPL
ncbi:hypothetical protein KEM54_001472 [Ascosphaera aggregata]|nr:hypothetical protein KEM54_001472 [Ascosphaera aggregata]